MWNKLSEKIPEMDRQVLVFNPGTRMMLCLFYPFPSFRNDLYWRELPEAPETEAVADAEVPSILRGA